MSPLALTISFFCINFKEKNKKKNPKIRINDAAGIDKIKLPEYEVTGINEIIIVHNV